MNKLKRFNIRVQEFTGDDGVEYPVVVSAEVAQPQLTVDALRMGPSDHER